MNKYKALLVGAGGMGRLWGENLRDNPDVTLGGWVDVQQDAAARAATDLGLSDLYIGADLDKALRRAMPDFVVDVTAIPVHHSVVTRAPFRRAHLGRKADGRHY